MIGLGRESGKVKTRTLENEGYGTRGTSGGRDSAQKVGRKKGSSPGEVSSAASRGVVWLCGYLRRSRGNRSARLSIEPIEKFHTTRFVAARREIVSERNDTIYS